MKAIWHRRDPSTDLIPEVWDLEHDLVGTRLYPTHDFRYDDMGGAYIRALMSLYDARHDSTVLKIMNAYVADLLPAIWDDRIAGGGFRYLNDTQGSEEDAQLETMYGLFIGTLLRTLPYLDDPCLRQELLDKCRDHASHVFLTNYGVKHCMIPHNLSEAGRYTNSQSDSQLAPAVVQFPLGMGMLSQFTGDDRYRVICRQVIDTLILRHAILDTVNAPPGYVDMVETTPPFRPEHEYYSWSWCREMLFLPAYILYQSIRPMGGVMIDWGHDVAPNVLGLSNGMPYWDRDKLNFDHAQRTLHCQVLASTDTGSVVLDELGFSGIGQVSCDGTECICFTGNTLRTKPGRHVYDITFRK